ncbi:MAG TPA: hypothetical protein VFX92_03885 [Candidatus Krumholzibacteria bacterium]|nr:hypothetical protein [Candidatus Krumholzibacteria bacterium]
MKRFSRPSSACSNTLIAVAVAAVLAGCGPRSVETTRAVHGDAACAALDSVLAGSLPARPWKLAGRATFDVDDYRVRGRYRLAVDANASAVFEFEGTMMLGGHREDVVLSMSADTLRVLDRERGAYYQGADVDDLIERGVHARGNWVAALRSVMGFAGACPRELEMRTDGEHVSGLVDGGAYVLTVDGGRLVRASWPDPTASRTFSDRLDVRYEWDGTRLSGITAALPVRGWRIVLTVE